MSALERECCSAIPNDLFRGGDVVEDGVDRFFGVVPRDCTLDVGQQLLVTIHHLLVISLNKAIDQ